MPFALAFATIPLCNRRWNLTINCTIVTLHGWSHKYDETVSKRTSKGQSRTSGVNINIRKQHLKWLWLQRALKLKFNKYNCIFISLNTLNLISDPFFQILKTTYVCQIKVIFSIDWVHDLWKRYFARQIKSHFKFGMNRKVTIWKYKNLKLVQQRSMLVFLYHDLIHIFWKQTELSTILSLRSLVSIILHYFCLFYA